MIAFGLLEWSGVLAAPAFFPAIRLGCASSLLLIFWLHRRPVGQRNPKGLFAGQMGAVGLMLVAMTISTGREHSPYFAGIALVQLATAVLIVIKHRENLRRLARGDECKWGQR